MNNIIDIDVIIDEEYIDPNRERAEKGLANASERGYNALTPSGEE